ncbi:hypothetical protein [Halioxenophilus sp. WMMB6]|uniref:hypothetical protein n=1 Tax=Halioxenophilus sp. WMMB6 TaxID=3073815 RepID=UPI00295F0471|nr:hypothetical protein [Halioxenophilus sp. WMMB6]
MSMPNSHESKKLFLHEKVRLGVDETTRFVEHFAECYRPLMEGQGARLYGLWEASEINACWPEITLIWEIDSYSHLANIANARHQNPETKQKFQQWRVLLGELKAKGEGRLMFGHAGIKSIEEHRSLGLNTSVVIEEVMTTKPNCQTRYIEELEYLYVPWSEETGKKWLGSFSTVFRNNEVIHYWALEGGWEAFGKYWPSWGDVPDPRIRSWMNMAPALREGWQDSFMQALPGNPLS